MKFVFYIGGKRKKQQIIKVKTKEDLILVAKIAKCELTKNSILKDLDFSSGKLMCIVKDKEFTMKELWTYLEPKINIDKESKSIKKKNKKKKSSIDKKKKDNKKHSKKKDKKIKNSQQKTNIKKSDGLIHITRK